jgi:hypothetical protein
VLTGKLTYISNHVFKGHGICTWLEYVGDGHKKKSDNPYIRKMPDAQVKGLMTPGATKRIRKYLDLWFNAIHAHRQKFNARNFKHKHFLTFVTLTLPSSQAHKDEFIKRYIFWPWLEIIKRYYGVQEYIWRAEKQANGNIHFHILIDKFIKHELVRFHWNYHLSKYGYIDAYSSIRSQLAPLELALLKLFKPELEPAQCKIRIEAATKSFVETHSPGKAFIPDIVRFSNYLKNRPAGITFKNVTDRITFDLGQGFKNPNSSDIHAPHKIKNLVSYVIKYMSKKKGSSEKELAISGRCWGRSDGLNKLEYFTTCEDSETQRILQSKALAQVSKEFIGDFFSFTRFNLYKHLRTFSRKLADQLQEHFLQLYASLYPQKQFVLNLNSFDP